MSRFTLVALVALVLVGALGPAFAQQDGVYRQAGVSFAYPGWEIFEDPPAREGEVISVRLVDPLRVCTLAQISSRPGGDNSDQEWINERMIERADALAQTMRHAGTITSTEILTIDGVAVIDAQAVGIERPQPDRSHDRFFALRHDDQFSSYRLDCLVFGEEAAGDRAAVDALMNSLHFDQD